MKKIVIYFLILFMFSCFDNKKKHIVNFDEIKLKWNKAYNNDSINNAIIGLSWGFSRIGAIILNSTVLEQKDNVFNININHLGFEEHTLKKLRILHSKIIKSEEYKIQNSIDLGRYITLLIGASEHYYALTNVPKKLDDMLANYQLKPYKGYVDNSSVSLEHRIIEFSSQDKLKQLFLSNEFDNKTKKVVEYETIEIMKNGQLRFGIFDENKNRINAANSKHSKAGKPAKCMWCHESSINQLFTDQNDFEGYLSSLQLNDTLIKFNHQLKEKQKLLINGVDFKKRQDHTFLELEYISFMEPSALRLSNEWNISIVEVKNLLKNLSTHTHEEFPFLGNLYYRKDVEKFAPYKSIAVSSFVREKSKIEVNYLK